MLPQAPVQQAAPVQAQGSCPPMPPQLFAFAKKTFPKSSDQQIMKGWSVICSQLQAKGMNPIDPQVMQQIMKTLADERVQKMASGNVAPPAQAPAQPMCSGGMVQHLAEGGDVQVPDAPEPDAQVAATAAAPDQPAALPSQAITPPAVPANIAAPTGGSATTPQAMMDQFNPQAMKDAQAAWEQKTADIKNTNAASNAIIGFGSGWHPEIYQQQMARQQQQIDQAQQGTVGLQEKLQAQATAGLQASQALQTMNINAAKFGMDQHTYEANLKLLNLQGATAQQLFDAQKDLADPNSSLSKAALIANRQALIDAGHPEAAQMLTEGMSGMQISAVVKAVQPTIQISFDNLKAKAAQMEAEAAKTQAAAATTTANVQAQKTKQEMAIQGNALGIHHWVAANPDGTPSTTTVPVGTAGAIPVDMKGGAVNVNAGGTYNATGLPMTPSATASQQNAAGNVQQTRGMTNMYEQSGLGSTLDTAIKQLLPSTMRGNGTATVRQALSNFPGAEENMKATLSKAFVQKLMQNAAVGGTAGSTQIAQQADKMAFDAMNQSAKVAINTLLSAKVDNERNKVLLQQQEQHMSGPGQGTLNGFQPNLPKHSLWNPSTGEVAVTDAAPKGQWRDVTNGAFYGAQ